MPQTNDLIAFTWTGFTICILLPVYQAQSGNYDYDPGTEDEISTPADPWETPMQELLRYANNCSRDVPGFIQTVLDAQVHWQSCIDSFSPKFSVLEPNRTSRDDQINSSVIHEIDKQLHMAVCSNTAGYKECWTGILNTLNECQPGIGDVSGKLYFALYDDICRDGGRHAVENRRKASDAGRLCERDYSTEECRTNRKFRKQYAKDLCLRFQSNVACDLSSIDPNCANEIDKRSHADIFARVEKVLQCTNTNLRETELSGSTSQRDFAFLSMPYLTILVISSPYFFQSI